MPPATALIFPYTEIEAGLLSRLARLFAPIILYQAVGMEPHPDQIEFVESGRLIIKRPGWEVIDEGRLHAALAEFRSWADGLKDLKDLSHLRAAAFAPAEEKKPPSALVSAIRRYGREEEEGPLAAHILLHMANFFDRRRAEMAGMVADLRSYEEGMGRAMGLKVDEEAEEGGGVFEAAVDPLAVPEPADDPLLAVRLQAWTALFRAEPTTHALWLTSPVVREELAEKLAGLELAACVDMDGIEAEDFGPLLEGLAQGQSQEEVRPAPVVGLRLWRLPGRGLSKLLELDSGDIEATGLLGEVVGWPHG